MQCIVRYATGMYSKLSQIRSETSQIFFQFAQYIVPIRLHLTQNIVPIKLHLTQCTVQPFSVTTRRSRIPCNINYSTILLTV